MERGKRWLWVGCLVATVCQRMPDEEPEPDDEDPYEGADAPEEFDGGIDVDEGETDPDGPPPLDDRPVIDADVDPPPISGGTLHLIDGGRTAIAADPDRDTVFVTPLDRADAVVAVTLEPGDEPGRVISDDDGLVHVALRGGAAIATIDPVGGVLVARNETCANPRGLALTVSRDQVLVACAGGELVTHELGGPLVERMYVAPDLRDVIVRPTGLVQVSQFRSARLISLFEGQVVLSQTPVLADRRSTTAWRTRAVGDDGWMMVHQSATTQAIDLEPQDRDPYGGESGCGPVATTMSISENDGSIRSSAPMRFATLPVDAALAPSGAFFIVVVAGQSDPSPTAQVQGGMAWIPTPEPPGGGDCQPVPLFPIDGQPIAVEIVDEETFVLQTREPASLQVFANLATTQYIELDATSRYDTGHELFHQDSGAGLSCASCHPEGGDDGFVWTFAPDVQRRTQSLRVGVDGTEPFHWDGNMTDFAMIVSEVHTRRMGGPEQSGARLSAFTDYVFSIPPYDPEPVDAALVERGSLVFGEAGCATCHSDEAIANGTQAILGNEPLQVPSLVGLALRPPYMHDGRATDIAHAVQDMLASTQPELTLPPEDIDALVAYLTSL